MKSIHIVATCPAHFAPASRHQTFSAYPKTQSTPPLCQATIPLRSPNYSRTCSAPLGTERRSLLVPVAKRHFTLPIGGLGRRANPALGNGAAENDLLRNRLRGRFGELLLELPDRTNPEVPPNICASKITMSVRMIEIIRNYRGADGSPGKPSQRQTTDRLFATARYSRLIAIGSTAGSILASVDPQAENIDEHAKSLRFVRQLRYEVKRRSTARRPTRLSISARKLSLCLPRVF